jgi:hypoxanthine phosphoribosyltransferase
MLNFQQKPDTDTDTDSNGNISDSRKSKDVLKKYISSSRIRKRIKKLAKKINKDYKGKSPILIGVLNGSFIFISDLARELKLELKIDFLKLSSYGAGKISSGQLTMLSELTCAIEGNDILVVEDIVDSGLSLKFLRDLILMQNPASLEFVTLLYKKGLSGLDFDIKYIGFKIPDKFVVGYGLDFAEKYRNLKAIYILKN